jgi:hypothetical protein
MILKREVGEEQKKRETGCVARDFSEDENWFCERVWSERSKRDVGGPQRGSLKVY